MELYTKEQIKKAYELIRRGDRYFDKDEILEQLTPIELPSDEEIKQKANEYTIDDDTYYSFINGAIWMKEKYLTKTNNMKQETKFINVHLQLVSDTKEILGTAEFSCLGYLKLKPEGIDTFEDVLTEMLKQIDPQNIPTSLTEVLNNQNK